MAPNGNTSFARFFVRGYNLVLAPHPIMIPITLYTQQKDSEESFRASKTRRILIMIYKTSHQDLNSRKVNCEKLKRIQISNSETKYQQPKCQLYKRQPFICGIMFFHYTTNTN